MDGAVVFIPTETYSLVTLVASVNGMHLKSDVEMQYIKYREKLFLGNKFV